MMLTMLSAWKCMSDIYYTGQVLHRLPRKSACTIACGSMQSGEHSLPLFEGHPELAVILVLDVYALSKLWILVLDGSSSLKRSVKEGC